MNGECPRSWPDQVLIKRRPGLGVFWAREMQNAWGAELEVDFATIL